MRKSDRMLHIPSGGFIYLSPANSQAKMGEAIGAVALVNLLARFRTRAEATQSRFLNWEDFRSQKLVLLGHDEANQWLDPILQQLPFRLAATEGDQPRRIVNTKPRKGESPEYRIQFPLKAVRREDYALISMFDGIDHQHELLLLNGLNTEGTQSAIEFLTNPATAQHLVAALRGKLRLRTAGRGGSRPSSILKFATRFPPAPASWHYTCFSSVSPSPGVCSLVHQCELRTPH